jgi:hypothetical protein
MSQFMLGGGNILIKATAHLLKLTSSSGMCHRDDDAATMMAFLFFVLAAVNTRLMMNAVTGAGSTQSNKVDPSVKTLSRPI